MSYFFANIMGILLTVVGLGVLVNLKNMQKVVDSLTANAALMYVTGMWILLLGIVMVLFHNIWIAGWPIVITILGWLTLLKGVVFIVFPGWVRSMKGMYAHMGWSVFAGLFALVFGLYFLYLVYGGMIMAL